MPEEHDCEVGCIVCSAKSNLTPYPIRVADVPIGFIYICSKCVGVELKFSWEEVKP